MHSQSPHVLVAVPLVVDVMPLNMEAVNQTQSKQPQPKRRPYKPSLAAQNVPAQWPTLDVASTVLRLATADHSCD